MAKFEKYDKVEVNKDIKFYKLLEGDEGIIMSDLIEDEYYAVAFHFDDEDKDTFTDCNGLVPSGKGLFIDEEDLRKIWGA